MCCRTTSRSHRISAALLPDEKVGTMCTAFRVQNCAKANCTSYIRTNIMSVHHVRREGRDGGVLLITMRTSMLLSANVTEKMILQMLRSQKFLPT